MTLTKRISANKTSCRGPGKPFVFVRTPGGSYADVGEVYTAGYEPNVFKGGDVRVTCVNDRAGTYDRISAWRYAIWHDADSPRKLYGPGRNEVLKWRI